MTELVIDSFARVEGSAPHSLIKLDQQVNRRVYFTFASAGEINASVLDSLSVHAHRRLENHSFISSVSNLINPFLDYTCYKKFELGCNIENTFQRWEQLRPSCDPSHEFTCRYATSIRLRITHLNFRECIMIKNMIAIKWTWFIFCYIVRYFGQYKCRFCKILNFMEFAPSPNGSLKLTNGSSAFRGCYLLVHLSELRPEQKSSRPRGCKGKNTRNQLLIAVQPEFEAPAPWLHLNSRAGTLGAQTYVGGRPAPSDREGTKSNDKRGCSPVHRRSLTQSSRQNSRSPASGLVDLRRAIGGPAMLEAAE